MANAAVTGQDGMVVGAFRIAAGVFAAATVAAGIVAANTAGSAMASPALPWCLMSLIALIFSALGAVVYNIPRNVASRLAYPGLALAHLATILAVFVGMAVSHTLNPDPAGVAQGYATLVSVYVHMGWLAGMGGIVAASVL